MPRGDGSVRRRRAWIATILTGVTIGALNLGHYAATTTIEGVSRPFGLFPGGLPLGLSLQLMGTQLSPTLVALMALGAGILLGASLSAWRAGELTLTKIRARPLRRQKVIQACAGGLLMGIGVPMADGCLVTHALSGAPSLVAGSWVALAGIVAGIWVAVTVDVRRA